MILIEDRRSLSLGITTATEAGARLHLACAIAGINARTLQRWRAHEGLVKGDGRPQAVRPTPSPHEIGRASCRERVSIDV